MPRAFVSVDESSTLPESVRTKLTEELDTHFAATRKIRDDYSAFGGVFPATEVAQDAYFYDNGPTDYTAMTGTLWNSPNLNTQGNNLVAANPEVPAIGCTNKSTNRTVGSIVDIEFILDGDKFGIHFQGFGYVDSQVWVEHDGVMKRIRDTPLVGDNDGFIFRQITFTSRARRRIRFTLPYLFFIQIIHEGNAVLRRSPDRPLMVTTGDSYVDASTALNAGSAKTFSTFGINDALIECTGFAIARQGQGGTGYFNNGTGAASDALGPGGTSRFFSTDRLDTIKALGVGSISYLLVNGTINDGELSGGRAGMRARALEGFEAVSDWDPGISIIVLGPEALNDPPAGGASDLNRQGLMDAVAEHPQCVGFLDVSKPGLAWWFGTGTEADPNTWDAQSKLVGMDGVHGNYDLYALYGRNTADEMGDFDVPAVRTVA